MRPENLPNYYKESFEYCYLIWKEESIWPLHISGYDAVLAGFYFIWKGCIPCNKCHLLLENVPRSMKLGSFDGC